MIFGKKEKEENDDLTENEFIEINKDISKALEEMKNEKDIIEEDNSDDNEEKEFNDFDLDFFSSNNSSVSTDYLNENPDNSFKSVNSELNKNKNNLVNYFKKNEKINVNTNIINNFNFMCNNFNINNANIWNESYLLNKNSSFTKNYDSNSNLEKKNEFEINNINNSFNSKESEEKINRKSFINNKINKNYSKIDDKNLSDINKNIDIGNKLSYIYNKIFSNNYYMNNDFEHKGKCNYHNINEFNNNSIRGNHNINIKNNININQNYINKNNMNNINFISSLSEGKNNKNKIIDSPKNIINIEKIIKGDDKRTTLIIRNIPNKYTISLLLKELNKNFYDKFNVIYLPQDYANNSNLGYGFINFINNFDLIQFYDMYQDKKWESFHSNKRCQLAYSKYQGKNELIKYINKKLGNYNINDNDNDKYHMKKSFFINNNIKCKKNVIEIPIKYYNMFISYYPYSLCHFQNDKIFRVDKYYNI